MQSESTVAPDQIAVVMKHQKGTFNDIKVPNPTPHIKRFIGVGNNYVVVLDKKIVQELKISEDTLVEQELTKEGILLEPRGYVQ